MSAFGGKADMTFCAAHVSFDPKRTLLRTLLKQKDPVGTVSEPSAPGPAALSSLWTSAWLIAASLFISPDLLGGRGAF